MEETHPLQQPTIPPVPPIPQSPPSVTTPTGRKQNIMMLMLIILTLCIVSATSWFFLSTKKTPAPPTPKPQEVIKLPSIAPTSNPMADWKTYIDKVHHFQIDYPSYLVPTNANNPTQSIEFNNNGDDSLKSLENGNFFIGMFIEKNPEKLSTLAYWQNKVKKGEVRNPTYKEVTVNDIPGVAVEWPRLDTNNTSVLIAADDEQIIIFQLNYYKNKIKDLKNAKKVFDTMLSTFKFTDAVTPTGVGGKFCGGIAGNLPQNQCAPGYTCQLKGTYPDAGGTCVISPIQTLQTFSVYPKAMEKEKKEVVSCTPTPGDSYSCRETMYTFHTDATPAQLYQFYNVKQKNGWTQIAGEGTVAPDHKSYSTQTTWQKGTETYTLYLAAQDGKILNYSISIPNN